MGLRSVQRETLCSRRTGCTLGLYLHFAGGTEWKLQSEGYRWDKQKDFLIPRPQLVINLMLCGRLSWPDRSELSHYITCGRTIVIRTPLHRSGD